MRVVVSLLLAVFLIACERTSMAPETSKSRSAPATAQLALEPAALCSALDEAGLTGTRWKEGAAGFGCTTNELQIGPRDPASATSSTVWYEVRGTDPSFPTTIVLGGDVRTPEAESAVRKKLTELANLLLHKLKMPLDEAFRSAIETNAPVDRRIGDYSVRYSSQMAGKVRENRLTIQRAL